MVDRQTLEGSINLVGDAADAVGAEETSRILIQRDPHPDLAPDPALPDDTRIWAALQDASGGTWSGAVFDADAILRVMAARRRALKESR